MKVTYTEEYKQVLIKLKNARLESKMTQLELSKKLNKPQSFVSKYESGERRLDIVELKKIAKILNKEINFFI